MRSEICVWVAFDWIGGCRTYGARRKIAFAYPALTDRAKLCRTYGAPGLDGYRFPALTDRAYLFRASGA
jgi:hypothetical protein